MKSSRRKNRRIGLLNVHDEVSVVFFVVARNDVKTRFILLYPADAEQHFVFLLESITLIFNS